MEVWRVRRVAFRSASAAVRASDDLEEVTARILPVHAPAAVVGVELTGPAPAWIGPVRQVPPLDAPEDLVKLGLGDQERVVLGVDRAVIVGEVEGDLIV